MRARLSHFKGGRKRDIRCRYCGRTLKDIVSRHLRAGHSCMGKAIRRKWDRDRIVKLAQRVLPM